MVDVLRGDGGGDVDVYVYDSSDRLTVSDTSSSNTCSVRWRPGWTGTYRVVVENASIGQSVRYSIHTN